MQDYNSDENSLDEPPRHDMLTVKFRGDSELVVLPYCEVANGNIRKVDTVEQHIVISNDSEDVTMTFKAFIKLVEETFDIKEVVQLALQQAESYDNIQIL